VEKSIVADLPVSCPSSRVNIFGRHRVDAGKRVGVCDCPVCQPQSIRHLSVRARVSHAHVISHARVHSGGRAPPFCSLRLLLSPTIGRKKEERPRETMPMLVLSVESQEANDRGGGGGGGGVPEKLIASWSDTGRFEMSSSHSLLRRSREKRRVKRGRTKSHHGSYRESRNCHSQSAHCVETVIIITTILVLILCILNIA